MIRFVEIIVASLVAASGVGFGVYSVVQDLKVERGLVLGGQLQAGNVVGEQGIATLLERKVASDVGPSCRNDRLLAEGLIANGVRDAVIRAGRPDLVGAALSNIAGISREQLSCSPGSGSAWAWLAISAAQTGGSREDVKAYLERSQWMAPSEYWVMVPRLQSVARMSTWYGGGFEGIMRSDIRSLFVSDLEASIVADAMGPVFSFLEVIAQDEYGKVEDPKRRDALMNSFGRWYANVAGCKPEHFRDWVYRGWVGDCRSGRYIPQFDWQTRSRPVEVK